MMSILFSPPDITDREIQEVVEVLNSGWITTGRKTKLFEQNIAKYLGTAKAVCLNSATAALELTLLYLGIGEGDEVITSAYTYSATASVIYHVGAKIVLADTAKDSFEMDYDSLGSLINENTKAIIPVDIGGKMCCYDKIFNCVIDKQELFRPKNPIQEKLGRIAVIADAAHSFGAVLDGKKAGQAADFTCFSFHAVKNLTTGEGGAVTWRKSEMFDDEELYQWFMLYSLHGQSKDAFAKNRLGAWEYDILSPAYKCNMPDISAALGLGQLERYDKLLKRRRQIAGYYDKIVKPLDCKVLDHFDGTHETSCHLYLIRVPGITEFRRNQIIEDFSAAGIACNVHYKPLPMLTAYKNLGFHIENFPNAYKQYENEISIPLNTKLTDEEVEYIGSCIKKIIG